MAGVDGMMIWNDDGVDALGNAEANISEPLQKSSFFYSVFLLVS
jgi:hypothetical protein